jgi:Zn-finger nucleic acid-binding protein
MRQVSLRSQRGRGSIDLCDQCGGVFLEFFDGEPAGLSREITAHLTGFDSPLRVGGAPPSCPDCDRHMDVYPYLGEGPNLARCNRCMAVFATPEQIRALSNFRIIEDAPSWAERALAAVRRWARAAR